MGFICLLNVVCLDTDSRTLVRKDNKKKSIRKTFHGKNGVLMYPRL